MRQIGRHCLHWPAHPLTRMVTNWATIVLPGAGRPKDMEMTVWVDAWQLQCCGEQSSTGSPVSWTLAEPDADWLTNVLGTQAGVAVDAREEHHGGIPDGTPQTAGTVIAVTAVHVEFALALGGNDRMRYPVASSAVLTPVAS